MAIRSPDPGLEERSDLPEDGVRAFGFRLVRGHLDVCVVPRLEL